MAVANSSYAGNDALVAALLADTGSATWVATRVPQRLPAAARVRGPIYGALSDGTKQSRAWRFKYPVLVTGHTVQLTYSNTYNNGGPEVDGPNPITVYAAVEQQGASGNVIPATPVGGITLQPGEQRTLDVPMEVTAGSDLWVRTQVSVGTLGQKWGGGPHIYWAGEGYVDTSAAPTTDVTVSTAVASFTLVSELSFGPATISVLNEGARRSSVLIIGTSIAYGVGNTSGPDKSWITEPLTTANVAHHNIAMPSSSAAQFATLTGRRRKMGWTNHVRYTHAVWEHLTNDALPVASLQANAITGWKVLTARGMKVIACTGLPKTDAGNTTPSTQNTDRIAYNNWLRDGAPMTSGYVASAVGSTGVLRIGDPAHLLSAYWEAADLAESARDSGLWKAGYTSDGIHPNATGHTALQAAVNLSSLT
jgi:hypothetical protein